MNTRNILTFCWLIAIFGIVNSVFSQTQEINFSLFTETNTPEDETVCLYKNNGGEWSISPMTKVSENKWMVKFDLTPNRWFRYKYCRNYMQDGAEEEWNGRENGFREIHITDLTSVIQDTVKKWRWWPIDGVVPDINLINHLHSPPDYLPRSNFQCGVFLPDFWWHQFIYSLEQTLDKIITDCNAEWIQITPISEIKQYYPTPIIVREGHNGTSEADLIETIEQIHRRGLKVYLRPFAWGDDLREPHDATWWIEFEQQWRPIIVYYAQIAQTYDVEVLGFGLWLQVWNLYQSEVQVFDSLAQTLLDDVYSIYSNKVAVGFSPFWPELQVYGKGDYLSLGISDFWPFRISDSNEPTVAEMTQRLSGQLDELYVSKIMKWKKPAIISAISSCSYDGTVIGEPNWETMPPWLPDDSNITLDLQE